MPRSSRVALASCLVLGCRSGAATAPPAEADARAGFALIGRLGCANCHAGEGLERVRAADLDSIGGLRTPRALRAALEAHAFDALDGLAGAEREAAATALQHFLAARGGP